MRKKADYLRIIGGIIMSFRNTILTMIIIAFLSIPIMGCEKEGTAEKAGKKIDNAIEAAKETVKKQTSD